MARKPTNIFHELRSSTDSLANESRGSDIYVIRAIGNLIHGIEVATEQVMLVDKSINKFEDQVTKFAKAADKSEAVMKQYTKIGLIVAIAQLVLAATIWMVTR